MVDVQRTFAVRPAPDVVVGYLKDFARTEEWDPGTVSCTRTDSGEVRVGSTWTNVSEFRGKETELAYRLEVLEPGHLVFVGENDTATSRDDITVEASDGGSTITYHADIEFHGLAKLTDPFMHRELSRLGDATEQRMTEVLDRL